MTDNLTTWDEIRRTADELDVKIHLAGMDARDRWHALQPRIANLEHAFVHTGEHAGDALTHELAAVRTALNELRDDLYARARGDFISGWQ